MKYLFAKNDPAEIRKAADQISDFCSKINRKHSADTSDGECIFFTIVGVACLAMGIFNLTPLLNETAVCVFSTAFIISIAIVFAEIKGAATSDWKGLIGHVINRKWNTPEILHAEEELDELSNKLDSIVFRLEMSKKIKNYYKTFGDSIKVDISRDNESDDLFHVVFSASLHKTIEDTVTYSDKFREGYLIKEDAMRRIFKNEDTIDFSWVDSDVEDAKNTFKDLLGRKQPLLESIKDEADLV